MGTLNLRTALCALALALAACHEWVPSTPSDVQLHPHAERRIHDQGLTWSAQGARVEDHTLIANPPPWCVQCVDTRIDLLAHPEALERRQLDRVATALAITGLSLVGAGAIIGIIVLAVSFRPVTGNSL